MTTKLPLREIAAHMRRCYPAEGCGLVCAGAAGARFVPITNVAGSDSISTRTVRDGYVMNPKELLAALEAADHEGESLYAIVHSHPDVGAYFSKEDKSKALTDEGEPLWPGVLYLVVSVRSGSVDGGCLYTWDEGRKDFSEEKVAEIAEFS